LGADTTEKKKPLKMPFEIYIPDNLTFQDYIAVIQTARVWADGYDTKV
jgi:scytalone dehydratase